MHIDCFHIYNTEYFSPEECEAYSEDAMYEALEHYVDYVQKYPDQKGTISAWLKTLSECGCSVDYEKQTFKVIDKNAFTKFLLGWSEKYDGHLHDLSLTDYEDLGELVYKCMSNTYCRFPTVMDYGVGYSSLYEALRHDLFFPWSKNKEVTYKLVAVADCHF